ncbi:MAG: hypothetical protein GY797_33455 [Deltaproteobacteria bacterium]|nr:hypothetical protein [Deltaproteobacteria bacterium]
MKSYLKVLLLTVFVLMVGVVPYAKADTYEILVDSSVNTLVGVTAIQVNNSTSRCTEFKIWEDTLTCDMVIYLGDPSDSSTMYYTVPGGTVGHVDYMIKDQRDNGIYVKTTVTAGVELINYISVIKKGYR